MSKTIKTLATLLPETASVFNDVELSGVCSDSRHVQSGDLFIALSGSDFNGVDFIDQAIDSGAAAVLVESSARWRRHDIYRNTPVVVLEGLQEKASEVARVYYAYDCDQLTAVGITGTNAKTSCSAYIQQLLSSMGHRCGVIGTLGWGVGEQLVYTGNTTPSNVLMHRIMHQFVEQGVRYAAVEVSSHGLELGRVSNVGFQIALFTNISRDHLDFHGTMQAYIDAKKKLFMMQSVECAVINVDDECAQEFIAAVAPDVRVLSYGFSESADVRVMNFRSSLDGMKADVAYVGEIYSIGSELIGDFNIYNLVASFAVMLCMEFKPHDIAKNVCHIRPVQGRMQRIENDLSLTVLVDFAHTPDGLNNVLKTLKEKASGQVWCVFGCGGDRDKGKRELMGCAADSYADRVILTSDNPRSEDPQVIVDEIAQACFGEHVQQILDRKEAINYALAHAEAGDCVLIAGKGHEDYQEVLNEKTFFSDEQVARDALAQLSNGDAK
ncbi:MAG: UDP-N-acetylmuramoyl-L-alanyl-D-glutamate--2,6-diaminopimelate ligase [Pseudomonadota bacterium]